MNKLIGYFHGTEWDTSNEVNVLAIMCITMELLNARFAHTHHDDIITEVRNIT